LPESRHRRRRNRGGAGRGGGRTAVPVATPRTRRRKTNWLYVAVSGFIAVLVIGGFAIGSVGLGHGGFSRSGESDTYVEGVGVQHEIMPTRNHLPQGQSIEYNSVPPTSGNHWAQWSECGFFEEEIPDERIVHNLEHSNIVVSYNLTSDEEVAQLRDVINDIGLANTTGVTRFYSEIPPGTVALSAWGVSDTMEGIDKDRIERFFETYSGTLGPEGNITCRNTGVMP
jgi:hypothetical protein